MTPTETPELTRDQVRRVDRLAIERYGMSGLVLMENAARGCVDLLLPRLSAGGQVAVCCGRGNNGGDGFAIARHLANRGVRVVVCLPFAFDTDSIDATFSGDAAVNLRLLEPCGVEIVDRIGDWPRLLGESDWVVDALLGTGAAGTPRAPLDAAIEQIAASERPVLAVDLPSGLDCDTGEANGAAAASLTATFVSPKVGFATKSAADVLGTIEVVDIGVPRRVIAEAIADEPHES